MYGGVSNEWVLSFAGDYFPMVRHLWTKRQCAVGNVPVSIADLIKYTRDEIHISSFCSFFFRGMAFTAHKNQHDEIKKAQDEHQVVRV